MLPGGVASSKGEWPSRKKSSGILVNYTFEVVSGSVMKRSHSRSVAVIWHAAKMMKGSVNSIKCSWGISTNDLHHSGARCIYLKRRFRVEKGSRTSVADSERERGRCNGVPLGALRFAKRGTRRPIVSGVKGSRRHTPPPSQNFFYHLFFSSSAALQNRADVVSFGCIKQADNSRRRRRGKNKKYCLLQQTRFISQKKIIIIYNTIF